jgi:predicted dehydrogenase
MISVGLLGAGRMGQIRARTITESGDSRLVAVCDSDPVRACALALASKAEVLADWKDLVGLAYVDAIIVATPTKFHQEMACAALTAGKHVLCEKPLARNAEEVESMLATAKSHGRVLKVGFNYRYMPHFAKAKELIDFGEIGPIYYLRCRFGHGGRPGYEREWHTDQELSGGGVLLEQGIHIIDLVRYLVGEPAEVLGQSKRYFWNFPVVEDNFFCLLKTRSGQMADIHVSWTQWVNALEIEIYGQDGYVHIQGRDGHYGPPRLVWAKRNEDHSRPHEARFEYQPGEWWGCEWRDFVNAVFASVEPMGNGADGLAAQRVIDAAYLSSRSGQWVVIPDKTARASKPMIVQTGEHK